MTGSMRAPSVKCEEIKEMVVDMLFRLPDDHGVFGNFTKDYGKPLSLNRL